MAQKSDVTYHATAKVKCVNCGSIYSFGSTIEDLSVEVCGNCHPFYTGQDTILDTTGRIEKFQARLAKIQLATDTAAKKVKQRRIRQSLSDLGIEDEQKEKQAS